MSSKQPQDDPSHVSGDLRRSVRASREFDEGVVERVLPYRHPAISPGKDDLKPFLKS